MDVKVVKSSETLLKEFKRKGGAAKTATHYCSGCGHGVVHKLIAEAVSELGIRDRVAFISPVGCSTFAYFYFNCSNIQAPHGRAAAVATGMTRSNDETVVISYQGDGDLASIGLNETIQAANRGEKMVVFFINNTVYGMTGGQMAPTTLVGEATMTTPRGRASIDQGHPIHMCEIIDTLKAPVFIERVSVATIARVRKCQKVIRKALEIQRDQKGYAFVEILSNCPTNLKMSAEECITFLEGQMREEFPLKNFRDHSGEAPPVIREKPRYEKEQLDAAFHLEKDSFQDPTPSSDFKTLEARVAGFGGQGVLSLGIILANASAAERRFVSWLPSYGPEMRGGTANCSVVVSGTPIGSPIVHDLDLLVAMNRPSYQKFSPEVRKGGLLLCDTIVGSVEAPEGVTCISVPALELATKIGSKKSANVVILGVLAALEATRLKRESLSIALEKSFASKKPEALKMNQAAFEAGLAWARTKELVPCA